MIVVTLVIIGIVCFIAGYLIADGISEKRFWDRQNYMEKLDRKF